TVSNLADRVAQITVWHLEIEVFAVGSNSGDGVGYYAELGQRGEAVFVVYVDDEDAAPVASGNANVEVRVLLPPRSYLIGVACGVSAAVSRGGAFIAHPTRENGHAVAG